MRPLVPGRVELLESHKVDDVLVRLTHTHMYRWIHRKETLGIYKDDHALEAESARRWKPSFGALWDRFVSEEESHTEVLFEGSSEVDRDLSLLIGSKLERLPVCVT